MLQHIFRLANISMTSSEPIMVYNPRFLHKLASLLESTSQRVLGNYRNCNLYSPLFCVISLITPRLMVDSMSSLDTQPLITRLTFIVCIVYSELHPMEYGEQISIIHHAGDEGYSVQHIILLVQCVQLYSTVVFTHFSLPCYRIIRRYNLRGYPCLLKHVA